MKKMTAFGDVPETEISSKVSVTSVEEQSKSEINVKIKKSLKIRLKALDLDASMKRTFSLDARSLVIFINSAFGKSYDVDKAEVIFLTTEYINSDLVKTLGDLVFSIDGDRYHIEFQTKSDGSILIRIFEYSVRDAISNRKSESDTRLSFKISRPLIIQVERGGSSSDSLEVEISVFGISDTILFKIPVIHVWKFTAKELIEKGWYLLLPYVLVKYREYGKNERLGIKNLEIKYEEFSKEHDFVLKTLKEFRSKELIGDIIYRALCKACVDIFQNMNEIYGKFGGISKKIKEVGIKMEDDLFDLLTELENLGREEGMEIGEEKVWRRLLGIC
jgi:hypothetical protein